MTLTRANPRLVWQFCVAYGLCTAWAVICPRVREMYRVCQSQMSDRRSAVVVMIRCCVALSSSAAHCHCITKAWQMEKLQRLCVRCVLYISILFVVPADLQDRQTRLHARAHMCGRSVCQVLGTSLVKTLVPEPSRERVRDNLADALSSEEPAFCAASVILRLLGKNQQVYELLVCMTCLESDEGEVDGVLIAGQDITQDLRAERRPCMSARHCAQCLKFRDDNRAS